MRLPSFFLLESVENTIRGGTYTESEPVDGLNVNSKLLRRRVRLSDLDHNFSVGLMIDDFICINDRLHVYSQPIVCVYKQTNYL